MGKILTYRVILTAPLLLTAPGGDPNSADTHLFISGSAIRGALASEYLRKRPVNDPAANDEFNNMFLSGAVRFLNAYPNPLCDEFSHNIRLLPTPRSFRVDKGNPSTVFDLASKDHEKVYRDSQTKLPRQLKSLTGEFVLLSGPTVFHYTPVTAVRLHNQRDRKAGRPVEGNIFSYVSLQPGERFIGNVLMDSDAHFEQLRELVLSLKYLGRSRRAEYGGGIMIEILPEQKSGDWRETGTTQTPTDNATGQLVVTLLSDYIASDVTAQSTIDSFTAELRDNGIPCGNKEDRSFVDYGIQGGYPGVWHLPYPQASSIAAGSVLVIRTSEPPNDGLVKKLEWNGLGARKTEGFGRICCNWHGKKKDFDYCMETYANPSPDAQGGDDNETDDKLLAFMRKQILAEALNRELSKEINALLQGYRPSAKTPLSLLGRLRAMVRTANKHNDILDWLANCSDKPAGKALNGLIMENAKLPDWIKQFLEIPQRVTGHRIWIILNADGLCKKKALLDDLAESTKALHDGEFIWKYQQKMLEALLSGMIDIIKKEEMNG